MVDPSRKASLVCGNVDDRAPLAQKLLLLVECEALQDRLVLNTSVMARYGEQYIDETQQDVQEDAAERPYIRLRVASRPIGHLRCGVGMGVHGGYSSSRFSLQLSPIQSEPKVCDVDLVVLDQDVCRLDVLVPTILLVQVTHRGADAAEERPQCPVRTLGKAFWRGSPWDPCLPRVP